MEPPHKPTTWLDRLQQQLKIDIDSMDPAETRKLLPFKPHDQTSNQRLVYEQLILPENHNLLLAVTKEAKEQGQGWEAILDRMSALLSAQNISNINPQGIIHLQTSPTQAYSTQKTLTHARSYAHELQKANIPKNRLCIKIPCTGPALNAAPILRSEGIRTLATSVFSVPQAVAAVQAGCWAVSPYFNLPWYHAHDEEWPDVDDPALEHPMAARVVHIMEAYSKLRDNGMEVPLLKVASFKSPREAMAIGELGCEHATIPADIIQQLAAHILEANPPPGMDSASGSRGVPARLAHLATRDPLSESGWARGLELGEVDYLADDGAALARAIEEDEATRRGLREALEGFEGYERRSREVILEVLRGFD
ncbi:aldolase [Aspergillus karnatakaensis]|uniref:aldolase n=1 Tax=Aspergillus karnatakaensis TaxID=1810916 RepID=UPI003CCCA025